MPLVFWTGKLSPMMKFVANFSNAIAWVTGNGRDTAAMKQHIKMGYDGAVTDNITRCDELGLEHFRNSFRTAACNRNYNGCDFGSRT